MSVIVLLGPQRFRPTLRKTIDSLGVDGPVAVITAGWQERESEYGELREHLKCEIHDLLLYHRHDDVLLRDRELAEAMIERQRLLRRQQELYRLRLSYALEAARTVMRREGEGGALDDHRRGAIRVLRTMDRQHVRCVRKIHEQFLQRWNPSSRPSVARHRDQLRQILDRTAVLAIAGGHVAVLLNRMRLFDVIPLGEGQPIVAWSAGAMAVSERVVLFHDSPPQGAGDPEVLDAGLGFCRGVLPLPHARKRLHLDDAVRVSLFARRFSPSTCVILDAGARVDWDGAGWSAGPDTLRMTRGGSLREMEHG